MKKTVSIIVSLSLVLSLCTVMTAYFALPSSAYAASVGKVQGVKVVNTTTSSVTLKWTKVSGATGYQVYYSTQKTKNYKIANTIKKGSTVKATVKKLKSNKKYYFKVRAVKNSQKGKFSNPVAKTTKITKPGMVKGLKVVKTTTSSVTLKWTKVKGATGYQVYYSTQKTKNYKIANTIKKGSTVKATVKKLKSNKKYYFKVRAVKNSQKGKFSNLVAKTTKKPVPPETYSITYELNGGEAENVCSYTKEDEVVINAPSRTGYTFTGWTGTDLSELTKDLVIPKGSTGNREYEAHWTANEFRISYNLNGGSASNPTSYTIENEVVINAPSRTGYTFVGWTGTDLSDHTKDLVIPEGSTGDREYEAHWTAKNYSINYELDGGSASNPTSYTVNDEVKLVAPTRDGYEFAGWTGTGLTEPAKELVIPKGSTDNRSYTANWTIIRYRIDLDLNGGSGVESPIYYTIEDEVSIPNPQRSNFDFAGWYVIDQNQGKDLEIPKGSTGNRSYTAHWYESYTISYDLDGGTLPDGCPTSYTGREELSIPNPTKKGYEFAGWTGTGLSEPTKELVIPQGATGVRAYTAHWIVNQYTVIFDANTGDGYMDPVTLTYDVSGFLPANSYTKADSKFICWNTKSDGTGDSYNNEARVENLVPEREITLYAQWASQDNCAEFLAGRDLNAKMKQIAGNSSASHTTMNNTIMSIVRSEDPAPEGTTPVSVESSFSYSQIYIWYEGDTKTIYYYSPAEYIYLNKNSSYLFSNLNELTNIDFSGFRTDETTNMSHMFSDCSAVTSLDLSSFNTAKVIDMSYMFSDCSAVTSMDLSSFNTAKVIDMSYMFSDCSAVTSMDLSSFNTAKVTNMSHMFSGCSAVTSLDLSSFNTTNVADMSNMFQSCQNCTEINVSKFDTQNVTKMSSMFNNCTKIEDIDLSSFNTAKVTEMATMFATCSAVTSLDLSSFNTAKVTDMSNMFSNCSAVTSLDLSSFNTTKVINMANMFYNCSAMTSLDLSSFNTSSVTIMRRMFSNCSAMTSLDLSSFNTSSVINMEKMFEEMGKLTTIYAGDDFTTASVTNGNNMFKSDSKLVGGMGTACDGSQNVDNTYARIDGGESSPGYFTRR